MNANYCTFRFKYIFLVVLFCSSIQIMAQESAFFEAMKSNNFTSVESLLSTRIDLCIYEDQDLYTKKVALNKISKWISENKIISITEVHSGHSSDNKSKYKVAQINTNEGAYRVFVYVSEENGKDIIKKIQIDRF